MQQEKELPRAVADGLARLTAAAPADLAEWEARGKQSPTAIEVRWHAIAVREQGGRIEDCPFGEIAHPEAAATWRRQFQMKKNSADKAEWERRKQERMKLR